MEPHKHTYHEGRRNICDKCYKEFTFTNSRKKHERTANDYDKSDNGVGLNNDEGHNSTKPNQRGKFVGCEGKERKPGTVCGPRLGEVTR